MVNIVEVNVEQNNKGMGDGCRKGGEKGGLREHFSSDVRLTLQSKLRLACIEVFNCKADIYAKQSHDILKLRASVSSRFNFAHVIAILLSLSVLWCSR